MNITEAQDITRVRDVFAKLADEALAKTAKADGDTDRAFLGGRADGFRTAARLLDECLRNTRVDH